MSLKDELKALRERLEAKRPPDIVATMHRAVDELRTSGAPGRVLKPDAPAPPFALPNAEGRVVDSSALLSRGPLIVTFYRGRWWPYCNVELVALQKVLPDIAALGASLVAISPQLPEHNRELIRSRGLGFEVLTDRGNVVATRFGLTFTLPQYLRDVYATFPLDITQYNGDASWALPMPGRFVIDRRGIIRYAESDPDYTSRPEPDETLAALRTLRGE